MMEFHISGRKTGKTSALLDWIEQTPKDEKRAIICHTQQAKMDILRRAHERGIREVTVYTPQQMHLLRGTNYRLAIDNLDLVLGVLTGLEIARVSATGTLVNRYD